MEMCDHCHMIYYLKGFIYLAEVGTKHFSKFKVGPVITKFVNDKENESNKIVGKAKVRQFIKAFHFFFR